MVTSGYRGVLRARGRFLILTAISGVSSSSRVCGHLEILATALAAARAPTTHASRGLMESEVGGGFLDEHLVVRLVTATVKYAKKGFKTASIPQ